MTDNPSAQVPSGTNDGIHSQQSTDPNDPRGPLLKDRSFWGLTVTQFLGAFNDNVYKQLVLLLALPVVVVGAAGAQASADMQGWATFVFSLPFVLFSGFAGYLSDRLSKTPIIVASKIAEIGIMLLGVLAFYNYENWGMFGTWTVLFLMATQSTFFGPGKYGVLPELFRPTDLPRANGLILMSTFLAIIFGVLIAGKLMDLFVDEAGNRNITQLWIASLVCVVIAVLGTLSSMLIRRTPAAQPQAQLTADNFGLAKEMIELFRRDKPLLMALLVSCVFWMVASIAMPTVNRVGSGMLLLDFDETSFLVGMIAVGIMLGAPLGGYLSRKLPYHRVVTLGLWGIAICLGFLGAWDGPQLWLSVWGARAALILLGISAAIYSIPLQVFLQERPPDMLKGRMIATMNQANFLGMMIAGPTYQLFLVIAGWLGWPVSSVFWMIGLLVVPIALFYRLGGRDQSNN